MLGIPMPGSAACSFWCISRLAHVVKLYTDAAFHSNKFLHSDKEIVAGPAREGQGFSVATTPRLSAVNVGEIEVTAPASPPVHTDGQKYNKRGCSR